MIDFGSIFASVAIQKAIDVAWERMFKSRVAPKESDDNFDTSKLSGRLQQLMAWHGLSGPQLLYFAKPEWNWGADDVSDAESLAAICRLEHLDWFAETFGIERAWLDGTDDIVTQSLPAYKWLDEFARHLRIDGWLHPSLEMTIFACDYRGPAKPLGNYVIVLSRQIISEHQDAPKIYRHALVESFSWTWRHWPARRDTKAIARWFSRTLHHCGEIPVVSICANDFQELVDRKVSPGKFLGEDAVREEFFEDRVLLERESVVAIPSPETEEILEYLRGSGLMSATL